MQIGNPNVPVSNEETRRIQQNPQLTLDRSTFEGSCTEEHGHGHGHGASSQMAMAIDNEPLWDWEHLYNWEDYI